MGSPLFTKKKEYSLKVLISACVVGKDVRWNGTNKLDDQIAKWAKKSGIDLVPVCPEHQLLGTPRPPIRLQQIEGRIAAVVNGLDIFDDLKETCKVIQNEHPEALGFIGIEKSPTCGVSVGVRSLGRTTKGAFHLDAPFPTTTINQMRSEKNRDMFLRRIQKYKKSLE